MAAVAPQPFAPIARPAAGAVSVGPGGGNPFATAISAARAQIGVPYQWGGETAGHGFDCSGLIQYAYAKQGINIPRTTYAQFQTGTPVAPKDLQPGDAVFFTGSDPQGGLPGHVGLYIGNGQVIEAPHTGSSVQIASLAQMSAADHYAGARRYGGGTAPLAAASTATAAIGAPAFPQQTASATAARPAAAPAAKSGPPLSLPPAPTGPPPLPTPVLAALRGLGVNLGGLR
jgi:NlpC/P60 family